MQKQYYGIADAYYDNVIKHHGILGQKWGVRRFQNADGSLTPAGRERYERKLRNTLRKGFTRMNKDRYEAYLRHVRTEDGGRHDFVLASKSKHHDEKDINAMYDFVHTVNMKLAAEHASKEMRSRIDTRYPLVEVDWDKDEYKVVFSTQTLPNHEGKYGGADYGSPVVHYKISKPNKPTDIRVNHWY